MTLFNSYSVVIFTRVLEVVIQESQNRGSQTEQNQNLNICYLSFFKRIRIRQSLSKFQQCHDIHLSQHRQIKNKQLRLGLKTPRRKDSNLKSPQRSDCLLFPRDIVTLHLKKRVGRGENTCHLIHIWSLWGFFPFLC